MSLLDVADGLPTVGGQVTLVWPLLAGSRLNSCEMTCRACTAREVTRARERHCLNDGGMSPERCATRFRNARRDVRSAIESVGPSGPNVLNSWLPDQGSNLGSSLVTPMPRR